MSIPGFDRAQAAYDAMLPPEPSEVDGDCDVCGDTGICPDCDPDGPYDDDRDSYGYDPMGLDGGDR